MFGEELGKGSFGTVSVVFDRQTGRERAVKVIKKQRKNICVTKLAEKIRLEVGISTLTPARMVWLSPLLQRFVRDHHVQIVETAAGRDLDRAAGQARSCEAAWSLSGISNA